jgi:hypothetical protein
MKRYQKIEAMLSRILLEKEKIDCEHVLKTARHGCACRRCRTARNVLTGRKL